MPRQLLHAPWEQAGWPERAHAWIRAQLVLRDLRVAGAIETVHTRPWSIILRVPTTRGNFYFKALPDLFAYEAKLMQALAQWHPDSIPELVGVDITRGWMLMADGGERLREIVRATRDPSPWFQILPQYVALQSALSLRLDELLAMGLPDYRPRALPAHYETLLQDTPILRLDQPKGLTSEEYARLRALAPQVAAWSAQLSAINIPDSLDHGDLHDGNVFVRDGHYTFIDWGDCAVAHPFFSMRVVLIGNENSLGLPDLDPSLAPLRDAYLSAWTSYASMPELRRAFKLSHWLANLAGALKWYGFVANVSDELREEFASPVPELLRGLLIFDTAQYPFV